VSLETDIFGPDPKDEERYARRLAAVLESERARREARRLLAAEERAEVPTPEILTLRDRLARPRPIARFRIEGWQPRDSRVILTAQFKAGKTTAIGGLLRSLVDGDDWLGRDRVDRVDGTVALVDTEMSPSHLDDWLAAQRIQHDNRVLVIPMRGQSSALDLVDPQTRGEWARRLRAADVQYLVLDCLRPVLDALGLDEHGEAGRFLVAFDALLAEAGIPEACLVHHMGHNGERSRGDSRLRDWPDVEWRLVRQDDDPSSARYITAFGRDVDQPESQLTYDPQTRRLAIVGGSRRDTKTEAALDAVLDVLAGTRAAMSVRAIQGALADSDHPRDTVRAAIRHGVSTGTITTESGARGAILHRPACERAGACEQRAAHGAGECAGGSIEPHTRTLIADGDESVCEPHTRFNPASAFLPTGKVPS
jgi:hypothetical protein